MPWAIDTLKGYPSGVKAQLQCNASLPAAARDYLLRLIDETIPIPLMVTINATGHELRNTASGAMTRHIVITLSSL